MWLICGLSLLNCDSKILSKIIARLESVISKIIHSDQTGLVKNRQGTDNVHLLFHIIDAAQKQQQPMVTVSMDAEKAFDRMEPYFLLQTLRAMNVGVHLFNILKHSLIPLRLRL